MAVHSFETACSGTADRSSVEVIRIQPVTATDQTRMARYPLIVPQDLLDNALVNFAAEMTCSVENEKTCRNLHILHRDRFAASVEPIDHECLSSRADTIGRDLQLYSSLIGGRNHIVQSGHTA